MKQRLKTLLREWLPPIVVKVLSKSIGKRIGFHGDYPNWEEAVAASTGYDQASILEKVKEATLKVKRGEAVYERDSVLFNQIEYSWSVLAGMMWAAAKKGGRLSVLDFGGSLGSSYFQNRKFLNELPDVSWGIVEQRHFVACGRKHIQDKRLRFYETIEGCVEELKPNVVLLGSVLQYLRNPYLILDQLSQVNANFLIIDRTTFSNLEKDRISIQHVPSSIYNASYPLWIFSHAGFKDKVGQQWHLIEEFECIGGSIETNTGIKCKHQGMIFYR